MRIESSGAIRGAAGGTASAPSPSRGPTAEPWTEALGPGAVAWEMDARTWRFTFVSPSALEVFGYPVRVWYDEPGFWQDRLLHPDDRAWCVDYCTVASGQCRDHAFHYRARAADGRVLLIKDVVKVFPDEGGRPARMRGIMMEVAGRGKAPDAAEEIDWDAADLEDYRVALVGEWNVG